jgi:hypothetical protein
VRGDLLGEIVALAAFAQAVLDVLVLALPLGAPAGAGHFASVSVGPGFQPLTISPPFG